MSIAKQVTKRVKEIKAGTIFGLKDFSTLENPQAVSLELSRLFKKGIIERLTRREHYFIPNPRWFGKLLAFGIANSRTGDQGQRRLLFRPDDTQSLGRYYASSSYNHHSRRALDTHS